MQKDNLTETLHLRLTKAERERLDKAAKTFNVPPSRLARHFISKSLNYKKKP